MNDDATDGSFGGIFFPERAPRAPGPAPGGTAPSLPTADEIAKMSIDDLAAILVGLLAPHMHRSLAEVLAGPVHRDGSLHIPSMDAVWLLSVLGAHVGKHPLVNLRHVKDPEQLRSVRGVAVLAFGPFHHQKGKR